MTYKRKMTSKSKKTKCPIKRRKTGKKTSFAAKVKKVVMKTGETNRLNISWNKIELFHNVLSLSQMLHLNAPSVLPQAGPGQSDRIGDRMSSLGWTVRMLIGQKVDRPNVNFRWFTISIPKGTNLVGINLPYNAIFENVTGNILLDDIQKDIVRVIATGYMRPNQAGLAATGNDEYTFTKWLFIPHKKTYKFGPGDSVRTHNQDDVYFFVM